MRDEEACRVLGVSPSASAEEVRAAYRRLVKIWHPDRHGTNPASRAAAEETLKRVIDAYRSLQADAETAAREPAPQPRAARRSLFTIDAEVPPFFGSGRRADRASRPERRRRTRPAVRIMVVGLVISVALAASWSWWFPPIQTMALRIGLVDVRELPRLPEDLEKVATLADRVACYSGSEGFEYCVVRRLVDRSLGVDPYPHTRPDSFQYLLCAKLQRDFSQAVYEQCVEELQPQRPR